MQALETANSIRFAIAAIRRDIRALPHMEARALVAKMLTEEQSVAFSAMRLETLLGAIHGWGAGKTRTVLRMLHVTLTGRRVRDLTVRQRALLVDLVANPDLFRRGTGTYEKQAA